MNFRKLILFFFIGCSLDALPQCQVIINSVAVTEFSASRATEVIVKGTLTGTCERLEVKMSCSASSAISRTIPNPTANWSVTFAAAELSRITCRCGGDIGVEAVCYPKNENTVPPCSSTTYTGFLSCPVTTCPKINNITASVEPCSEGTDGNFTVNVHAEVTGTVNELEWIFEDSEDELELDYPAGLNTSFVYHCPVPGLTYEARLEIEYDECNGENDDSKVVYFQFPSCNVCPLSGDQLTFTLNNCEATFTYSDIGNDACGVTNATLHWDFGDGETAPFTSDTQDHTYRCNGSFTARLMNSTGTNCFLQKLIEVTSCGSCDQTNRPNPPDESEENGCGWKFWNCMDIDVNLCWLFALLAMIVVAIRLLLIALYDYTTPVVFGVTVETLLNAISLSLLIPFLIACPCEVLIGIIIGAGLAIIIMIVILIFGGTSAIPNWIRAGVLAILLIVSSAIALGVSNC